jgi:hypothetical protein
MSALRYEHVHPNFTKGAGLTARIIGAAVEVRTETKVLVSSNQFMRGVGRRS